MGYLEPPPTFRLGGNFDELHIEKFPFLDTKVNAFGDVRLTCASCTKHLLPFFLMGWSN